MNHSNSFIHPYLLKTHYVQQPYNRSAKMVCSSHPHVTHSEGIMAILMNSSAACGHSAIFSTSFLFRSPLISHLKVILIELDYFYQKIR